MAYLVVTLKGKELYRRELSGPLTLGRSTDCELWINDAGVSRRHCRFERAGDDWEIVDLDSRNGVVLHGERVARHKLRDGESVHTGSAKVTFHAVGFVSSRPATPQGSGDSISDTIIAGKASLNGRTFPTPRAAAPGRAAPAAPKPAAPEAPAAPTPAAAPLAFTRPPARPMPVAGESTGNGDGTGDSVDDHVERRQRRVGLLRRFLRHNK